MDDGVAVPPPGVAAAVGERAIGGGAGSCAGRTDRDVGGDTKTNNVYRNAVRRETTPRRTTTHGAHAQSSVLNLVARRHESD
jgi:hypothetical protein